MRFGTDNKMKQITNEDMELVENAHQIILDRFREGYHHIGAALRTRKGTVYSAVHLEAYVGRVAVCAEAVALGMAAAAGDTDIDTVAAVDHHGNVVSPCGMCRELIADYAPYCKIVVPGPHGPEVMYVVDLLPNKYKR